MIYIKLVLILNLLNCLHFGLGRVIINLCVPEDQISQCRGLSHLYSAIQCVPVRDKFACMAQIARNRADIVKVGPEDLYVAGSIFGLEPFMAEEINGKKVKKESAILVRKDSNIRNFSDLKGKRSCHSGYGQVTGWNIPISLMINDGVIKESCKGEMHSAEKFFSSSCAPGNWSQDPLVDKLLKKKHYKLCELCQDPYTCSSADRYAGDEGAIRCLTDGQADVAFVSLESALSYFQKYRYLRDDYQLLCHSGGVASLNNPCQGIGEPTEVWISRSNTTQNLIFHNILEQIHFRTKVDDNHFNIILASSRNVTHLSYLITPDNRPYTYHDHLGDYIKTIKLTNSNCSKPIIRICTRSQAELSKCLDLQKVADSRRSIPSRIMCENPGSSVGACIDAIRKDKADIISLEASDLYLASKHRSLMPVAKEMLNQSDVAFYAVAVVRNPSPINSVNMLVNTTACSSAYGDSAGWTAPVGSLVVDQDLPRNNCYPLVSTYFKSMCVPGITGHTHDPNNTAELETLCGLCLGNGQGEHVCEKSSSERYYDESGAFRCLAEKRGEVAFVRHTTPLAYTTRQILNNWSANLRSGDFKLLCRDGSQGLIDEYEKCHIASIPTRSVIMLRWTDSEKYMNVIHFLASISSVFRDANQSFRLFGKYDNEENLIFNDMTTRLSSIEDGKGWEDILGEFFKFASYTDEKLCHSSSAITSASYLITFIVIAIHLIVLN